MLPALHEFVNDAREAGAVIIWVVDKHRRDKPDFELERVRFHCTEGTLGVELAPPLRALPEDYHRHQKSLFRLLRDRSRSHPAQRDTLSRLILTGTKTNVCVRAAAQDAFARNYDLLIPRELVATDRENLHLANLEDMDRYFGRVLPAAAVLAQLREGTVTANETQHA